jgi:NAD(P)-dependent dehydrogenase (short-subunit alcohol dehydrogenase family)
MKRYPEDMLGRTAIVTGAGNGLGLGLAKRLLAGGARVLFVDQDPVVLTRVEAGKAMFAMVKDLAEPNAAADVFAYAKEKLGAIDTLINNAAWSFHKPMTEVTTAEFDRLIAINQRAPFFLAQEFVKQLKQPEDPTIVNIGSVNALRGNPNLVPYAGTKGAIVAMTRAMAVELAEAGIRVNNICPAAIHTHVTQGLIDSGVIVPEKLFQKYLIKRFSSVEEIAELVAYLCSDAARYVTGATWEIDAGYCAT